MDSDVRKQGERGVRRTRGRRKSQGAMCQGTDYQRGVGSAHWTLGEPRCVSQNHPSEGQKAAGIHPWIPILPG